MSTLGENVESKRGAAAGAPLRIECSQPGGNGSGTSVLIERSQPGGTVRGIPLGGTGDADDSSETLTRLTRPLAQLTRFTRPP